ncbi:hypothetical protein LguiA_019767 [Lonicera macranthoides]
MDKNEAYGFNRFGSNNNNDDDKFVVIEGGNELDLVAASSFGGQRRKKRMARQRRSSVNLLLPFPPASSSHVPPPLPSRASGIGPRRLGFLFEKELKKSDVSGLRRMILPKKSAEAHLPYLEVKEGIYMRMDDMDGSGQTTTVGWEFVRTHGLKHGDYIMLYQDLENQNFVIKGRKASTQNVNSDYQANQVYNDRAWNAVNGYLLNDIEVNKTNCSFENFPRVEEPGSSFIYDTTTFSNDSPLDFLGGSMTNYSRVEPPATFGSIENLSLEDF